MGKTYSEHDKFGDPERVYVLQRNRRNDRGGESVPHYLSSTTSDQEIN